MQKTIWVSFELTSAQKLAEIYSQKRGILNFRVLHNFWSKFLKNGFDLDIHLKVLPNS